MEKNSYMMNPYVEQMEKFGKSLEHLADTFFRMEERKGQFTSGEVEEMFSRVSGAVCKNCENRSWCLGENQVRTKQLVYEILKTADEYGAELNMDLKKRLQRYCILAPRFLRETMETFQNAKQAMFWNNRIVQSREGCAVELDTFARLIRHATRELDSSIFSDERLEKKIRAKLKSENIRILSMVFLMTPQGRYEIHLTGRAAKGECISTKELARILSICTGKIMETAKDERRSLGPEYATIVFLEMQHYYTLQGVARIGKGCAGISGDSFSMMELPAGKQGAVLSDGMGSGEEAYRESAMVVDMLEELLEAGFPARTALEMMNTALVIGREEIRFSTIDISIFDLYEGTVDILKAGASTTFIRHQNGVERICSTNLPLGVVQDLEIQSVHKHLQNGDFVIMITDGIMDALPVGEQEFLLDTIIRGTSLNNPKEMAHHILEQVLEWTGEDPMDDMTVLVIGIWRI